MANNFASNPWTIDTAFATVIAKNHITNSYIYVKSITWTDQLAAGNQVTIQDRNGNLIQDALAQAANTPIILNNPGWVNGLVVPTLAAGKLSIVVGR